MNDSKTVIGLDVGEKRIGVAVGDRIIKIASPLITIEVDGHELELINKIVIDESVDTIVVGYPRSQSGNISEQTRYVERFVENLKTVCTGNTFIFQDESLTSIIAEDQLKKHNRPYSKGDIDALAAAIILNDYLEA